MVVQSVPVNESQKVYLRVSGDLIMEGGTSDALTLHGGRGDFRVEQLEGQVVVVCSGDLRAELPAKGQVMAERVSGNVDVHSAGCDLKMERLSGDLTVEGAENLWVEQVSGQVVVSMVNGSLVLGKVGGDLVGEQIGRLTALRVGGDVHLRQVGLGGDLRCGGDLLIVPTQCGASAVTLRAGGDVMVHLLPEFNAEVLLESDERGIYLNFGNQHSKLDVKKHLLSLGTGGPLLTILAGGELMLTDQAWEGDPSSLRLEQAFAGQPWRVGPRIQGLDRKMRGKMERKMGRMARKELFTPPIPPIPPIPPVPMEPKFDVRPTRQEEQAQPRENVSNDERLMVLQMLRDGKINAEHADLLLSALRG